MSFHTAATKTLVGRPAARHPTPGALVRELLRPEAYPGPRPGGVELRHTHASWVFLTEEDAWKVRRPVAGDGLGGGDADRRRRCAEDEVRLGRVLAPGVYRGVVPVHREEDGGAFVGSGPIVDYAVRMRRLADEDSAAVLLALGRLTAAHLQQLAAHLAHFHETSTSTPELAAPVLFREAIDDNHAQLRAFAGRFINGALANQLHRWQRARTLACEPHLADRASRGRFREGHGDLRLEHVYFPDAGTAPLVIDPLAFNRRLRCGDVALDVAMVAVDLEASRRADLAAWFLSCFARASHDHDFAPLVDLYCSYRASVRAKVACLVAADPTTGPAKASRKAAEAARMLGLAASYMEPWEPRA